MDHSQARISLGVTEVYTGCWETQKRELCESLVRKGCRDEVLGGGPEIGGKGSHGFGGLTVSTSLYWEFRGMWGK